MAGNPLAGSLMALPRGEAPSKPEPEAVPKPTQDEPKPEAVPKQIQDEPKPEAVRKPSQDEPKPCSVPNPLQLALPEPVPKPIQEEPKPCSVPTALPEPVPEPIQEEPKQLKPRPKPESSVPKPQEAHTTRGHSFDSAWRADMLDTSHPGDVAPPSQSESPGGLGSEIPLGFSPGSEQTRGIDECSVHSKRSRSSGSLPSTVHKFDKTYHRSLGCKDPC